MSQRMIQAGGRAILYHFNRAATNRLSISVYPDLTVRVRAPLEADDESIELRLQRKVPWILRHLRSFERLHPLPVRRQYVSGETHSYLGRQYRLRVRRGPESVQVSRPFLVVTGASTASPRRVRQLMDEWYWMRAEHLFPRRVGRVLERTPWLGAPPRLRIREMKTRWGSCSAKGVITLSLELIKAPLACIDYVIAHELCHRLELRHTPRFYALMKRAVPRWEQVREQLNRAVR